MWFIKGSPDDIDYQLRGSSLENGYQQTDIKLCIKGEYPEYILSMVFPYSVNKEKGSLKFVEKYFTGEMPLNINIYDSARKLKTINDTSLMNIQEMHNYYNWDDFGFLTLTVKNNVEYSLSYTHKINSKSVVFLPIKLPTIIESRKPKMNVKVYANNVLLYNIEKFLIKAESDIKDSNLYLIDKKFDYTKDIEFKTNNWESSDDELYDSDN